MTSPDALALPIPLVLVAFAVLGLVSAGLARLVMRLRIMDVPGGRKAHARPTPKAGGLCVIGACVAALGVFPGLAGGAVGVALAGAVLLGLVGLVDDLDGLGVWGKLAAQVFAACAVVQLWPPLGFGPAGAAMAVGWLVFATNAFNFMDGLDGLAGGTGLVAAVFLAVAAPAGGATQVAALAVAAGLAGFLVFNLHPARLFLGDTGSQFCGFFLGALGVTLAGEDGAAGSFWLVPALLSGMVADVGVTLLRRWHAGAPVTRPHREHFYQRARLPVRAVAVVHWGFAGAGGVVWLSSSGDSAWRGMLVLTVIQLTWLGFVQAGGVRIRPRSW